MRIGKRKTQREKKVVRKKGGKRRWIVSVARSSRVRFLTEEKSCGILGKDGKILPLV